MKFKLRPNETVEWRSKKGTGFWARMALPLVGSLLFLVFFQYLWNDGVWNTGLTAWLIATMGILGAFVFYCIKGHAIEYRLTNQRIVKTTFGRVTKEYPLSMWEGKPVSQYLHIHSSYYANNEQRFVVSVLHPKTLDTVLKCKDASPSAITILKKIGHIVKCSYCKTTNSVFNPRCIHCGGSL